MRSFSFWAFLDQLAHSAHYKPCQNSARILLNLNLRKLPGCSGTCALGHYIEIRTALLASLFSITKEKQCFLIFFKKQTQKYCNLKWAAEGPVPLGRGVGLSCEDHGWRKQEGCRAGCRRGRTSVPAPALCSVAEIKHVDSSILQFLFLVHCIWKFKNNCLPIPAHFDPFLPFLFPFLIQVAMVSSLVFFHNLYSVWWW